MGHGMSVCGAAYVDAGARTGVVEESECECGCVVADYAVHYAVPRCCNGFQHLLCQTIAGDGRHIHGRSSRRLLRLRDCAVGYKRARTGQTGLYAVSRQWRLGKHGPLRSRRHHDSSVVLPGPGCWRPYVRRAERRFPRSPLGDDVGFLLQRPPGPADAHHAVLLPRSRLAGQCPRTHDSDADGHPHHPGLVQFDAFDRRDVFHDDGLDPVVHGWDHHLHCVVQSPGLGVCEG